MKFKSILSYIPFVLLLGFVAIMQFTSYEQVDKLPVLRGEGIQWQDLSFEQALDVAIKEDKPIFIDFYATWCRPCKMLKSVTFPRESVGELFNKEFINLTIDVDKPAGRILANKYNVHSYPTILILDKNGGELGRKESFIIPILLTNWGEELLGLAKQNVPN
jgi:thioredoxin 1